MTLVKDRSELSGNVTQKKSATSMMLVVFSVILFIAGYVMWGSEMPVLGIVSMLVSIATFVAAMFSTIIDR